MWDRTHRIINLVTISKILERLVLARIRPLARTSKGGSVCFSLPTDEDTLNTSVESGSESVPLSFDILAAFDTIDSNFCSCWSFDFGGFDPTAHRQIMLFGHRRTLGPRSGDLMLAFLGGSDWTLRIFWIFFLEKMMSLNRTVLLDLSVIIQYSSTPPMHQNHPWVIIYCSRVRNIAR